MLPRSTEIQPCVASIRPSPSNHITFHDFLAEVTNKDLSKIGARRAPAKGVGRVRQQDGAHGPCLDSPMAFLDSPMACTARLARCPRAMPWQPDGLPWQPHWHAPWLALTAPWQAPWLPMAWPMACPKARRDTPVVLCLPCQAHKGPTKNTVDHTNSTKAIFLVASKDCNTTLTTWPPNVATRRA